MPSASFVAATDGAVNFGGTVGCDVGLGASAATGVMEHVKTSGWLRDAVLDADPGAARRRWFRDYDRRLTSR